MLFNLVAYTQNMSAMQGGGMIGLAPEKMGQGTEDTMLFTKQLGVKMFGLNVP